MASNVATIIPISPASRANAIEPTMSSREIADLCDKRHDHVLRDIRVMLASLYGDDDVQKGAPDRDMWEAFFNKLGMGIDSPLLGNQRIQGVTVARDSRGFIAEIGLDHNHSMTLVSGYNVKLRKAIIDRWQQLEAEVADRSGFALPQTMSEALRLAANEIEKREQVEFQRDEAIRTKAQIGSRREASAMATASAARREVGRLMDELGRNARHATIIAVERATKHSYGSQGWRPLRAYCEAHGLVAQHVSDPRYGEVNAWPASAWRAVYDVDLAALFPGRGAA